MGHLFLLAQLILVSSSYVVLAEDPIDNEIANSPSKSSSDSRKDYYWKLWAKLIFGCIALIFACCKCCRQCQKSSEDEDDDDVIKNDKELRVYCDLCKEECLNPWHTHDFYCKAIKASTSIGSTFERLNIPLSDLKCPKCIHGYLGLRPPDVIPIDSRFKFICDLKEKVPENHVRLMNLVEGNEEKNQFTCMNCMCNLCLRCVRDMKLRNRPLKIVQWFHLGDESRLFDNFRRSEGHFKDVIHPPPSLRYGGFPPENAGGGFYHSHHVLDCPPYLPTAAESYPTPPPPPPPPPNAVSNNNAGYASSSPNDGGYAPNSMQQHQQQQQPSEEPVTTSSSNNNLLLLSDLQRSNRQRMKGLNRSWSIMYPDSFPSDSPASHPHHPPPTSHKKRGPLNRSLSVSTDFVVGKAPFEEYDIFNRHPKASKNYQVLKHQPSLQQQVQQQAVITRSVSTKKIPMVDTTSAQRPRRGPLNRSLTIIDEPPATVKQTRRGILNRSASMSTQQLAKASNALENERRAFEATFIKKMDEEELEVAGGDELVVGGRVSSYGDLTSEDSRQTPNEDDYLSSKGSSLLGGSAGASKRGANRPKLRAQFSTDELDVRRVVCQSRNEKRYSGGSGPNSNVNGGNSNGPPSVPGYSAINV